MSPRLIILVVVAILIAGAVYSAANDLETVDAQTAPVVCPTPTPSPTPTGPATRTPTPTTGVARPLPAFPMDYRGRATVAGNPLPDCSEIYAKVGDFESPRRPVIGGEYVSLSIAAPDVSYNGLVITFHLSDDLIADQTDTYVYAQAPAFSMFKQGFNLTFPHLVTPEPTVTPTSPPTATPTNTPLPTHTPTATPTPTNSPTPTNTPTPIIAQPAIYSGPLVIAGGAVPPGSVLTARIGSYESFPALVSGQSYQNLVVAPQSASLIGQRIEFFLNGFRAATTDAYDSGSFKTAFALTFVGFPTATMTPTNTATTVIATNTPVPTRTPVPTLTSTPEPTVTPTPTPTPTATLRPTRTPLPTLVPTNTPRPVVTPSLVPEPSETATPAPTATPESSGGFCSSSGQVPLAAGIGNLLMLIGPVGMVYGVRRLRRRSLV